ncbi:unnamed protein product, partial [Mesorhabditis belari]|uniref:Mitochondrial carrier protein n=1 Tax=Mesorhabditis belari TaxID=2138241 RepID=A0AAF3EU36_9BILA
MAAVDANVQIAHDPFLGMAEEDEKFYKGLAAKTLVTGLTYPITVVKTLIQLGHEPFPLSTGKIFVFCGRNAYFLPNGFSYAQQLAHAKGLSILWTGLDSALVSFVVGGVAGHVATKFLNDHYPAVGGSAEFEGKEEKNMTDHESFRRMLRAAIRDSTVRTFAVACARPFTVVCIRQVAQVIGGETKYQSVFHGLRLVGVEEGPGGLFSGFIPQLLGELLVIWGVHSLTYFAERAIIRSGLYEKAAENEQGQKELDDVRKAVHFIVPFVVNSAAYPYSVVSTVMAVAGSGLAVSFLPYSPAFPNWMNAWDYLKPHGLKRGARLFLREQIGAVSVGSDKQLYATNRHFV